MLRSVTPTGPSGRPATFAAVISTVIFDFGGVISSPLFVGIGAFEEAEGYPKGSLLQLLFGETHYIGVEGRAVAEAIGRRSRRGRSRGRGRRRARLAPAREGPDRRRDLLRRGSSEKAPAVLGKPIDMEAYGRFWRQSAPGVHWMVVHKIRELKARGLRLGLLTNNVKEFGEHWRTMFPLDELFEEVVDSSHVGMRKPEREIYELTCARMGIAPDRGDLRRRQRRQRRGRARVRHGGRALRREPVGRARRARRDPRARGASTATRR